MVDLNHLDRQILVTALGTPRSISSAIPTAEHNWPGVQ